MVLTFSHDERHEPNTSEQQVNISESTEQEIHIFYSMLSNLYLCM